MRTSSGISSPMQILAFAGRAEIFTELGMAYFSVNFKICDLSRNQKSSSPIGFEDFLRDLCGEGLLAMILRSQSDEKYPRKAVGKDKFSARGFNHDNLGV